MTCDYDRCKHCIIEKILALRSDGLTYQEIGETLKITRQLVSILYRKYKT